MPDLFTSHFTFPLQLGMISKCGIFQSMSETKFNSGRRAYMYPCMHIRMHEHHRQTLCTSLSMATQNIYACMCSCACVCVTVCPVKREEEGRKERREGCAHGADRFSSGDRGPCTSHEFHGCVLVSLLSCTPLLQIRTVCVSVSVFFILLEKYLCVCLLSRMCVCLCVCRFVAYVCVCRVSLCTFASLNV